MQASRNQPPSSIGPAHGADPSTADKYLPPVFDLRARERVPMWLWLGVGAVVVFLVLFIGTLALTRNRLAERPRTTTVVATPQPATPEPQASVLMPVPSPESPRPIPAPGEAPRVTVRSIPVPNSGNAPAMQAVPPPLGTLKPTPGPHEPSLAVPVPSTPPTGLELPTRTGEAPVFVPAPVQPTPRPRQADVASGGLRIYFDADSTTYDRSDRRLPLRVEIYVNGRRVVDDSDPEKREFNLGRLPAGEHELRIIPFVGNASSDARTERITIEAGRANRFAAVLHRSDGVASIRKFRDRD